MPPATYEVIAEVSSQDPAAIDRIQRTLGLTFNIDLAPQRAQLRKGGVVLCQVATLDEARQRAQQARDAGADFRIVASDGRVVLEGAGRASTRVPAGPAAQAARQGTQLGGYQPANAVPPPLSTNRTDPLAQTQPSSDAKPAPIPTPGVSTLPGAKPSGLGGALSGAGRRSIPTKPGVPSFASRPSSPGSAPSPAAAWKPDGPSTADATVHDPPPQDDLDFLPEHTGQAAAPGSASPSAKALDELNADDLVLLDGTSDAAPARSTGPASLAGHGTAKPPAKPAPPPPAPKAAEVAQLFGDEAFAPPVGEDEALELDEQAMVHPAAPAPEAAPPQEEAPVEDEAPLEELVQQRPAPPPPEPTAPPAAAPRPRPPRERRVPVASFFSEPPERLLFGGWFRQSPRLRIVVGFALALGLGAILPTCHAHSVVSKRIQPQLEDLSTAKAHGPLIAHLPNYRSPGQIEQDISDIKTRHGIYGALIWLICSGLLGFAWFRYS